MISQREWDDHGRLFREKFPNGRTIEISYDAWDRVVKIFLEEAGSIIYKYDATHLLEVARVAADGQTMYAESYEYGSSGELLYKRLISQLGQTSYRKDVDDRSLWIESPYHQEFCYFNSEGMLTKHSVDGKTFEYGCDSDQQLVLFEDLEQRPFIEYDQSGNLTKKISARGEHALKFDQYGNLIEILTENCIVNYFYDDLNRRIAKKTWKEGQEKTETFLYFGENELAIYSEEGTLKQLRVPGLSFQDNFIVPIAIETSEDVYAPIYDCLGNLSKLINTKNRQIVTISSIDPFGQNLNSVFSPTSWLFASKYYDTDTHLVYFGSRYYDPELKQWLTPDPLGTLQHPNVYLYCLGNPLSYFDPDGKFAIPLVNLTWGGVGVLVTFPAWGAAAAATAATAVVGWAAYEVIQKVKEEKSAEWQSSDNPSTPPYRGDKLGNDPSKKPDQGFEWKGKGVPGSKRGSWHNPSTGESLHPDLDHLAPIKPHWDYEGPNGEKARLNIDGTWVWK